MFIIKSWILLIATLLLIFKKMHHRKASERKHDLQNYVQKSNHFPDNFVDYLLHTAAEVFGNYFIIIEHKL